jgi:hypothetical protein
MNDLPLVEGLLITASIVTAATVVIIALLKSGKFIKKVIHFFDDFLGEEERAGVPARPGFSERMSKMEKCIEKVDERLSTIEYKVASIDKELQPNSGLSARDAINRIEKRLDVIEAKTNA